MEASMKASQLFKVFSLTSTMAIAALLVSSLTPTVAAKTEYEPFDNPERIGQFDPADQPMLQAQNRDRQQIAQQVVYLYREMVGRNASISDRYLNAYVNCIDQNVCTWEDIRAHIAYTHQIDDRSYRSERRGNRGRRSTPASWGNRGGTHNRRDRYDRYDRDDRYDDDEVLQAQSRDRDQIEDQVVRLYREMLGDNARISRRDLRDYANCIERDRCDWDDIREEIAYSYDAEEEIEEIYEEVLERDPDSGGMRTYQNRLADDWNIEDVREDIAESDEAERRINQIYREILGRNADRGGMRTYQRKLGEGWSLDKVRRDIADSDEARRRRGG
jgi:hypothetical protein